MVVAHLLAEDNHDMSSKAAKGTLKEFDPTRSLSLTWIHQS
jgi:hypothetical protein